VLCKKCVLSEHHPDIKLNKDGICNICIEYETEKAAIRAGRLLESDLVKLLDKYRGKGIYDCLVMCSGGKDSIGSLYYMKKRYRMNPLVFTFDHGFENEEALNNIRNAVSILKTDWLYFKTDFMKDIFAIMIKNNVPAPLCHVCAIWYTQLTYETAARYGIPLIVAGWTRGQMGIGGEEAKEYLSMSKATADFVNTYLHKDPKYRHFPLNINEAINTTQKKLKITMISPHWFLSKEIEQLVEILSRELSWKAPALSYPKGSTNCLMNFASVMLTLKHFGYTHYHIEMSKLVREGALSREEALEKLKIDFNPEFVDNIVKLVGCELPK